MRLADEYNPFTGINPSFGPFAGLLESKFGMFLALAWVIGFFACAYFLIEAIGRAAKSRRNGMVGDLDETRGELVRVGAATIGMASLPVLYTILISA
ncbi:hypothetical protein [Streptomyces profundus]|uniref:hypothetical protein n=1 Tax=Streptomyces profundus TaxID=2867410 RepID=UPI001D161ECE|nr:hypothetical protein [Streptomyces sp. MA3_2.13]UED84727.1 hypothetical protein K4G22_11345 [Streptomyces sp. MA3_2.13]